MKEKILSLKGLSKSFGETRVLNHISFDIYKGEFVTLLGPSGCGKTTTLRLIAGLETPDDGDIYIKDENITAVPSEKRRVNTVFQNYALFPHMNVFNNIAYGLKIKKTPKDIIRQKVMQMLEQVQMSGYESRMPNHLSGGQRQRIAIARALVNEPDVLLLDEPLGALDLKLRQHMQSELKAIQERLDITFVYVTHDQDEALNMSNRLVVMNEGSICQIGTPKEIYETPKNRFVAEFVGDRNIIQGQFSHKKDGRFFINYGGSQIEATDSNNADTMYRNSDILATIHADKVEISVNKPAGFSVTGKVIQCTYTGALTRTDVELESGETFKKSEYNCDREFEKGQTVFLSWKAEDCLILESEAV